jgi:hypothetical protein
MGHPVDRPSKALQPYDSAALLPLLLDRNQPLNGYDPDFIAGR